MQTITTKQAVDTLIAALVTDQSFYYSYQANIAMAFQDEAVQAGVNLDSKQMHILSNNAAIRFLNLFCNDYRTWEQREADKAAHTPISPVDENEIALRREIGTTFMEFADRFFLDQYNPKLDTYLQFGFVLNLYRLNSDGYVTPNTFRYRLEKWCAYKGYIHNPAELTNDVGRILRKQKKLNYIKGEGWRYGAKLETLEFIYIKTFGTELTTKGLTEPDETTNG